MSGDRKGTRTEVSASTLEETTLNLRASVFMSYATQDEERLLNPVVRALEARGFSCWYASAEILPGQNIGQAIARGISSSNYFLALVSSTYLERGHPKSELSEAVHLSRSEGSPHVICVMADGLSPSALNQSLTHLLSLPWNEDPDTVAEAILALHREKNPQAGRVALVSSEWPPHVVGGLGIHVTQLANALASRMSVDVLLPTRGGYQDTGRGDPGHPRIIQLSRSDPTYDSPVSWLNHANVVADRIESMQTAGAGPDLIHCHDWVTALVGVRCKYTLGIPFVFHLHLPNRTPLCASVENLGLVVADLVTVNSESIREELNGRARELNFDMGNVRVVKNGVDRSVFLPRYDWPMHDGYLLFVGRLVQQKGVDILLRALYYVREAFPNVKLKIVGEGHLKESLESLARNLSLSDEIEFLGSRGLTNRLDLAALYQGARAVIVPSIYEPFGMTAIEAMACGKPIISSRVGGLSEIVQHDINGLHFEPYDELDLAQWVMRLLDDDELSRRLTDGARKSVDDSFEWPTIADEFSGMYADLISSELNLSIPDKAKEFQEQIRRVSKELAGEKFPNRTLDDLFKWSADL